MDNKEEVLVGIDDDKNVEVTASITDDQQDRINAFTTELNALIEKHKIGISAEPRIVDGKIVAQPILVDVSTTIGGTKK